MPPLAAVPDLERELDALYALPLDEFTRARNDLAARLRKAHQSEAAESVRTLKKPSVVAWAANNLAHTQPDLVHRLLEAGARLREVQQRALAGEEEAAHVADVTTQEREAVRALVVAAREQLGARANPSLLDRLTQTLRAAATDPELAPRLRAGRLTDELQAVGFGPLEAVTPIRRRNDDAERAARERVAALRAEARRLAAEAREAERRADELRAAAERAADALAHAESELER
jgi:hypothetical protein